MLETIKAWFSHKKNASLSIFMAFLVVVTLFATHLQWGNGQRMIEGEVPVYSSNRSDASPLIPIQKGEVYYPIHKEGDWEKILSPSRQIGFMPTTTLAEQTKASKRVAIVSSRTANLRRQPDAKSYLLATAKKGNQFVVLDENKEWIKVRHEKSIAYINAHSVNVRDGKIAKGANSSSIPMKDRKIKITANEAKLYAESHTNSTVIDHVKKGKTFQVVGVLEDFYEVAYNKDLFAFVKKSAAKANFTPIERVNIPKSIKDSTIVIDPGHGGEDPGASSDYTKKHEKDFTLKVSKSLAKRLKGLGAHVILTREDDSNLSLRNRAKLANEETADVFISLHFDSSGENNENSGITSYYYNKHDLALSQVINHSLKKINIQNNGDQFGDFMVLRESDCPSVLLEMGYMNNKKDVKRIESKKYQQQLVYRISDGLENYFRHQGKIPQSKAK